MAWKLKKLHIGGCSIAESCNIDLEGRLGMASTLKNSIDLDSENVLLLIISLRVLKG